jgi:hypothetical protein
MRDLGTRIAYTAGPGAAQNRPFRNSPPGAYVPDERNELAMSRPRFRIDLARGAEPIRIVGIVPNRAVSTLRST